MTGPGDDEGGTPKMHAVALVWGGVGVGALVVAVVATSLVVAVFGVLALVAGGVLYAGQNARMRSARETQQVLHGPVEPYPEPEPEPAAAEPTDDDPRPPADRDEDE